MLKSPVDEEEFLYAIGTHFDLPVFSLKNVVLQRWVLDSLPWPLVSSRLIVPFYIHEGTLTVLCPVPLDRSEIEALERLSSHRVVQALATTSELRAAISHLLYS